MSLIRLSLLLLLLNLAFAQTQQPPAYNPANHHKVSGSVVNSITGEPIARALVNGSGLSTFSDNSGHFEFDSVPEGQMFFSANRPGYSPNVPGPRRNALTSISADTPNVVIKLVPLASIRGRVVNADNEPLEGVNLRLFRNVINDGFASWQLRNTTNTDSSGAYEISDIEPGTYLIETMPEKLYREWGPLEVNGQHLPDSYPATYYPDTQDRATAQPLKLTPGSASEADFRLKAIPTYTISGSVPPGTKAGVHCEGGDQGEEGNVQGMGMVNPQTGKFRLFGVMPGTCNLVAISFSEGGPGSQQRAERRLNVNSDLTGIDLAFSGTAIEIPIVEPDQTNISLTLRARNPDGSLGYSIPQHMDNGHQPAKHFTDVRPGTYHVMAQVAGPNCLATIAAGGVDLTKDDLVVAPGASAPAITVTTRNDCASLKATLDGAQQDTNWWLLLVGPAGPLRPMVSSAADLNYPNLAPGDYTAFAFDDIAKLEYGRPEILSKYSGQHVTINANDKATLQLKLQTVRADAE